MNYKTETTTRKLVLRPRHTFQRCGEEPYTLYTSLLELELNF